MATELKPQIHAYIAYGWVDFHEAQNDKQDPGQWKLIGWDTVSADDVSTYQRMLGTVGVCVYLWEIGHPMLTLYRWNNHSGWVNCKGQEDMWIPQDLRMKVLCGAI